MRLTAWCNRWMAVAAAAMVIGGRCDGRRRRGWHDRGGRLQRRRPRNGRRGGGAIRMRGIEIAVDGGGGDGRRRRNGRQDGRASTAGQGDGVSPSSRC
jgi:hypothetical protein